MGDWVTRFHEDPFRRQLRTATERVVSDLQMSEARVDPGGCSAVHSTLLFASLHHRLYLLLYDMDESLRVAVVGAGVSGLAAVWGLNEYSAHSVSLFEPLSWLGGHANTVTFTPPTCASSASAPSTRVDTGFIVFNRVTYPNLLRFLQLTGVEILDSDMSFSVTRHARAYGAFEWAGGSPAALFCQPTNLLNPSHWRMVWDIVRFNQQAVDYLRLPHSGDEISIGAWLDARHYSAGFRKNYLIPMTASIWSTAPETALSSFPALTLLRFMHNHHLLQILDRPQWLTIKNGSRSYVDRITSKLPPHRIHQGPHKGAVQAAWIDDKGKWTIETADGQHHPNFDRVIFATHADQTAAILRAGLRHSSSSLTETLAVLDRFGFSHNTAVLHADTRLMPVRRAAWSAWNFLAETQRGGDVDRVSLTYWMNLLQSLPEAKFGPVLVTLNPSTEPESPYTPRPELVVRRQTYSHPIYTPDSVAAQHELQQLQGGKGAFFVGAWTKYGFHEDGFASGLRAAAAIEGVYLPFDVRHAERAVPTTKQWGCIVAETVDAIARCRVICLPVTMAFYVAFALLALVHALALVAAPRLVDAIATVKSHISNSLSPTTPAKCTKSA